MIQAKLSELMLTAIERDMVTAADEAKLQRGRVCLVIMCDLQAVSTNVVASILYRRRCLSCRHLHSKLNNGLEMIASDASTGPTE